MADKQDLETWLVDALHGADGWAHHVRLAEAIWREHELDLRRSGDLFYTWQYDLRWAAKRLRDRGVMEAVHSRSDGIWRLANA
jgi:hypothetical protein